MPNNAAASLDLSRWRLLAAAALIFLPALTFVVERLSRSYGLPTLEADCRTVSAEKRTYKQLLCFDLPAGKALDPNTGDTFPLNELFSRPISKRAGE